MRLASLLLLLTVISIFSLGLIMVFDTSSAEVLNLSLDKSMHYAFFKQLSYALLGCFLGGVIYWIGYIPLMKFSQLLLIACVILLIMTFLPYVGQEQNGANRWITIGGYSIQPSEMAKLVIPLYYIYISEVKRLRRMDFMAFYKNLIPIALVFILIFLEPDNGTIGILGIMLIGLFYVTKIPWRFWGLPLLIGIVLMVGVATQVDYVSNRIQVYLHPEIDIQGRGHQPYQAKIATGSGGFLGKGVGRSLQKLNYLPEAQNDYIAAIYAEEFGFIGIVVLISLYMLLVFFGYWISIKAEDKKAMYLGSIISFSIGLQVFLNLGVASGLLPSTGLNLPFFSQGGTSLVVNMASIALLLSIAHKNNTVKEVSL